MDAKLFSLLLYDAAHLIRPRAVVVVSPSQQSASSPVDLNTHPNALAFLALSDLAKAFETVNKVKAEGDVTQTRQNHITLKIQFYVIQILLTPALMLAALADEITIRAKTTEAEAGSSLSNSTLDRQSEMAKSISQTRSARNADKPEGLLGQATIPRIEELS